LDLGVDTVDLADIYGDYEATKMFGEVLQADPTLSKRIKVVTKAGIVLLSDKHPEVYVKHYDTSAEHIIASVDQSLLDLGRDHIDLLLIHRPDPYMDPWKWAMPLMSSTRKERCFLLAYPTSCLIITHYSQST